MLNVIEKLLILQDRDRTIQRVQIELSNVGPEREALQKRAGDSQNALEAIKLKAKQIETQRKELELEVEARKQQIDKYSLQQFQTRKNEEYRALAHEIETCKAQITQLEDQQLELMEKGEAAQKEIAEAARLASQMREQAESLLKDLAGREQNLQKQLADLQANYGALVDAVEESILLRYQRLRKNRGEHAVVGIEHSVCGGCHMKLPTQIVITCQGQREVVSCPNCGRILYFAPHMDLAVAD